jgi:hypothetical protein
LLVGNISESVFHVLFLIHILSSSLIPKLLIKCLVFKGSGDVVITLVAEPSFHIANTEVLTVEHNPEPIMPIS